MKIEVSTDLAKKLYNTIQTPDSLKEILEENFGKTNLKNKSWQDIKSFEDALEILGRSKEEVYKGTYDPLIQNQLEIETIIEAINEKWVPNFADVNQPKWYIWFSFSGSGFSSSGANCGYDGAHSCIGSRFLFQNKEKTIYFAKNFEKKYSDYLLSK